ncbi:alpha/beta hydrolase [Methylonatrum kenyense]|uniref:alpha/beta fold hydrolase n=1 Tax=Methylonatrum kenyense TaxID=455253 RepID=UPI0020BE9010|nr:alpha/beta hydrolase [Methylonatrum kenyense]MCK8514782.1 alpha/beta hydrolase [Methylonatrum kenyense]
MFPDGFRRHSHCGSEITINLQEGGNGPPLLLLHGYPQNHVMWHRLAPLLRQQFHLVCPDLRGYGDSDKPEGGPDHAGYSKRAMARDMVEVMQALGYQRFAVAGHDRGARVAHRMMLDFPERVSRGCVMDIAPTLHMFETTDQTFATGYYHWFFLIQPDGLPERMIGADPDYYLQQKLQRWSAPGARFDPDAVADYLRCFRDPATIHASCEDYRAAAGIDLTHDRADRGRRLEQPLLVLWGKRGFVHRQYDVAGVWRDYASDMQAAALDAGHFLPEEVPEAVAAELQRFFAAP